MPTIPELVLIIDADRLVHMVPDRQAALAIGCWPRPAGVDELPCSVIDTASGLLVQPRVVVFVHPGRPPLDGGWSSVTYSS
ncbi:MAG: hypothetical protein FD119_130 [Stygiobacter sp.]|nr:MAG: hypothetical protein FD119_130 [Stygiobacter sp.]